MKQTSPGENSILLRGRLLADPALSHQNHQLQFFRFPLEVRRLSGAADQINVILSQQLLETLPALYCGQSLQVSGEVRTYNNRSGIGSKLVITVLARSITPAAPEEGKEDENRLLLSGTLCRPPVLRSTPLGRSICDLTLAVNRTYGRADYLPCIAWGSVAYHCAAMEIGDPLRLEGRLQSRIYTKLLDGQPQERTAFEVSVMRLIEPEEERAEAAFSPRWARQKSE